MPASVFVDGKKLSLNPFMTTLAGNLIEAVARSLKSPSGNRIEFLLRGEELRLQVDQNEVPLDLGHAQQIVGGLFRGFLSSLHGAEAGSQFQFIWER